MGQVSCIVHPMLVIMMTIIMIGKVQWTSRQYMANPMHLAWVSTPLKTWWAPNHDLCRVGKNYPFSSLNLPLLYDYLLFNLCTQDVRMLIEVNCCTCSTHGDPYLFITRCAQSDCWKWGINRSAPTQKSIVPVKQHQ